LRPWRSHRRSCANGANGVRARRTSVVRNVRSRRDRACTSYDLRSRRRKASYRFGAEQPNLVKELAQIAQIIATYPPAAKAFFELAATRVLEKCGIEEDGIDKNCPQLEELRNYIKNWDPAKGPGPVPKSVKFGVDPADKKAAMKSLEALIKEAVEADAANKKAEDAYYKKLADITKNLNHVVYPVTKNEK
jgi:hypothetical protein